MRLYRKRLHPLRDKNPLAACGGIFRLCLDLRPEFFLACGFHLALAFGTGAPIPNADVVAAAVEAESADLAPVGWRHIGNDASDHDVLDGLAVGT